jgi:hypothetical protein
MSVPAVLAQQPIETVDQLGAHLYQAAKLEMSTIPLYLYANYSIQTRGYSQSSTGTSAWRAIKSVVIEEMLHLCLARNLLVAIGQRERIAFYDDGFLPKYPEPMLHRTPELMFHLEPCSIELMKEVFVPLESPSPVNVSPQPDSYGTIGAFYEAIVEGFERLSGPELWKEPCTNLQYYTTYWNQDGGGYPLQVKDLPTALDAIKTIVEQGEGAAPGDLEVPLKPTEPKLGAEELSHYGKFLRIAEGIDGIGEVWPLPTDPRTSEYQEPARSLAKLFNAAYCYLLKMLDALYETPSESAGEAGASSPRYGLERTCIAAMGGILFPIADLLVRQPSGREGLNAAPTFEFHRFAEDSPSRDQLSSLCAKLAKDYPSLGGADGVQRLIGLLPSV